MTENNRWKIMVILIVVIALIITVLWGVVNNSFLGIPLGIVSLVFVIHDLIMMVTRKMEPTKNIHLLHGFRIMLSAIPGFWVFSRDEILLLYKNVPLMEEFWVTGVLIGTWLVIAIAFIFLRERWNLEERVKSPPF